MTNTRDIRFATITARFLDHEGMAMGHFKTCGHHRADCPAIKPDSIRLNLPTEDDERKWGFEPTLNGYCTAAEWFDGEAQYDAPIPCKVCCAPNGRG